jgi:hypothetical protein
MADKRVVSLLGNIRPMMEPNLSFDCADAARAVAHFSVGFAMLTVRDSIEEAIPAGSGTLVSIGSLDGVLTAGHVLQNLPDRGHVGLLRFPGHSALLQKQTIDMALADKVIIAADSPGPTGPDLGFLRLPPLNVENLRATNSFHNIAAKRDAVAAAQPAIAYIDAVIGVVAEWTKDAVPTRPSTRYKNFELLFCGGKIVSKDSAGFFDLCRFEPSFQEGVPPPSSYGGVSGGGIWRIYFEPDGSNHVHENRLVGLAFYEWPASDGSHHLICHGPRSIYDHLIDAVREKWPESPLRRP